MVKIIVTLNIFILYYFLVVAAIYSLLFLISIPEIIKRYRIVLRNKLFPLTQQHESIPITVIVSAYNEEKNILNCVQSIFNSSYDNTNVLVVSDGSTDGTLSNLDHKYRLKPYIPILPTEVYESLGKYNYYISSTHPNLIVVDKPHTGTGDSLNTGLKVATSPFVISVDADSLTDHDMLKELMAVILNVRSSVIVGGAVNILNGIRYTHGTITEVKLSKSPVVALQTAEYLRSFVFGRIGWNAFKGPLSLSGTCTLLEREKALALGGFDLNNPAQDAEIVVHQHERLLRDKTPYRVVYTPTALAWTLVPNTFKSFAIQRVKWQCGLLKSFFKHFRMCFNPRYGVVGLFSYPFYLFVETLGPVVEFTAYTLLVLSMIIGIFNLKVTLIFIILAWGFLSYLTVGTMLLNLITFNQYRKLSNIWVMFLLAFFEMFGFRQFLIVCRMWGTIKYFLFKKYRK